jgi:transcriptional antiterminator
MDLQDEGLSIKQIAKQLDVSERTVKRDLARIEPYVKKQWTQLQNEVHDEFIEWFTGLSLKQQLGNTKALEEEKKNLDRAQP